MEILVTIWWRFVAEWLGSLWSSWCLEVIDCCVHICMFFLCFAASVITWWWWSLGGDLLFSCLHVSFAAFLTIMMFCWKCYYMVMMVFMLACFFCSLYDQDHHDVLLWCSVITYWRSRSLFESVCCLHVSFAAFVIIISFFGSVFTW